MVSEVCLWIAFCDDVIMILVQVWHFLSCHLLQPQPMSKYFQRIFPCRKDSRKKEITKGFFELVCVIFTSI
jgi:hypothetical protein